MLLLRAWGCGETLHTPRGTARCCCHKNAGVRVGAQPEGPAAQPSPGQQAEFTFSSLALPLRTLPNVKEVSSSSLSPAVCLALVPSRPTFATTTLSPQNGSSWGAGPELWLRLPLHGPDFQHAASGFRSGPDGPPSAFQRNQMLLTS